MADDRQRPVDAVDALGYFEVPIAGKL